MTEAALGSERADGEGRLRHLLESIDDHFVQYDRQWRYTFITARGAAVLGKTPEQLLGRSIWEVFPDAVGNPYYQRLHEAAATGKTVRFEFFYEPFGKWFDNHVYPTADGVIVFSADITERKLTEYELRHAERRQSALIEMVPVGIYWCDADGYLQYCNARAVELWGRTPIVGKDRFCGSHGLYTTDGTPIPHDRCPLRFALDGESIRNAEVVMERPDGTRITCVVNIEPLRDDAGRLIGAVNVFQDITDRRRADEALSRLAAIVASSHDAIIGKDLAGRVLSWNAAAERLYGYSEAEMIGQPVTRLYPPERATEEDLLLERIRAGERVEHFETIRVRKDGQPVDVAVTVSPVRDGSGRIVGASSASRDISERKVHERELRVSEARYRSLAEASGAIVFVSNNNAEWLAPVPAWEAYTGLTFERYRGRGWAAALHPDDLPRVQAQVEGSLARNELNHTECRVWHAASRTFRWNEARIVPLSDSHGRVREWIGAIVDVHARKTAEEAVRAADRRKDEFLAVLAHELRNPLAPIVSSLHLLRVPQPERARGDLLDVMDRQVRHLVRLVDDLMEVSRITRGAIELRREPLLVADIVRGAVEINRELIDAHGHRLELVFPESSPSVFGDRVRLTQVVANLLNNAAKYTPRNGLIRVTVEAADASALVRVEDNGLGIEPSHQDRIFEMFQRGGRELDGFASGLGIGLGLSRRLAELHAGTLDVYSPGEGHGSVFTLRLPRHVAPQPQDRPAPAVARSTAPRRVLVVDDNRDAAETLAGLLRVLGHEVCTAHDGETALVEAPRFGPELILLDLGMPAPDGFEVARRIRSAPWGRQVRLVALSGWGQDRDRSRSRDSGFDLHLVKPVGLEQVQALLASRVGPELPPGLSAN